MAVRVPVNVFKDFAEIPKSLGAREFSRVIF